MTYVLYVQEWCTASEYFLVTSAKSSKTGKLATHGNLHSGDAHHHPHLLNPEHAVSEHENVFICIAESLIYLKSEVLNYFPFTVSLVLCLIGNPFSATFLLPTGSMLSSPPTTDCTSSPSTSPNQTGLLQAEVGCSLGTRQCSDCSGVGVVPTNTFSPAKWSPESPSCCVAISI